MRHDLIAAVFALGGEDDLVRLLARVEALAAFLGTEDGANLLTAYRRAANIVAHRGEEGRRYAMTARPIPALLRAGRGNALAARLDGVERGAPAALEARGFRRRHGGARPVARPGR